MHDLRPAEDPSPLDRALMDEALRSDRPPPISEVQRFYGIGNWSQMRVRGVGVARAR